MIPFLDGNRYIDPNVRIITTDDNNIKLFKILNYKTLNDSISKTNEKE